MEGPTEGPSCKIQVPGLPGLAQLGVIRITRMPTNVPPLGESPLRRRLACRTERFQGQGFTVEPSPGIEGPEEREILLSL